MKWKSCTKDGSYYGLFGRYVLYGCGEWGLYGYRMVGKVRLISYAMISPTRSMLRRKRMRSPCICTSRISERNWLKRLLLWLKLIIFINIFRFLGVYYLDSSLQRNKIKLICKVDLAILLHKYKSLNDYGFFSVITSLN